MVLSHTQPIRKLESAILLQKYQQYRLTIRNQLVILNFGLVRKEAHYWSNVTENYDDLFKWLYRVNSGDRTV